MLVSVYAWIRRYVCVCLIVFEGRPSRCVVIVQILDSLIFFLYLNAGMLLNHQRVWCGCQVCKLVRMLAS